MPILDFKVEQAGMSGVLPRVIYINTNDTVAEVTAAGYLNGIVQQNTPLYETDIALVSTKTSPSAASSQVAFYDVAKSGQNWSLSASNGILTLANGRIFVGNASNVATGVAMSGDIAITNAGVTSIVAGAIVNADVNAAAAIAFSKLAALPSAQILVGSAGNVATAVAMSGDVAISNTGATTIQAGAIDLAMLSAGITPSHVIKFAGQPTTVGGAAAEAFAIPGVLVTDLAFVQVVDDGTGNVTVLQAACTADTLTVTFSANPGNDTIINYQIIRAAA